MPDVTVVIPVFNRAHIVGRAIASVLAQDVPSDGGVISVIVVDDGSSDDLDDVLRHFGKSVTCIRHECNKGAAAARNTGVAAATGRYVAFLDSDDIWLPGKFAAQIEFMEAHGYWASCTAYLLKRPNVPEFASPRHRTGALGLSDLVWGCFFSPGSTLIFRREIFVEIGMLDEGLQRLEDWDWLLRYTKMYMLGFLAQPLARIFVEPQSNAAKVFAALDCIEEKHAALLPARERRHFEAALCVERAAALYRCGDRVAALAALTKSLWRVPFGNTAAAVVLHNRFRGSGVELSLPS